MSGLEFDDEAVQRGGQGDRPIAQNEKSPAVLMTNVLDSQHADGAELLGIEEDQETGDPVGDRVCVVVQDRRGDIEDPRVVSNALMETSSRG